MSRKSRISASHAIALQLIDCILEVGSGMLGELNNANVADAVLAVGEPIELLDVVFPSVEAEDGWHLNLGANDGDGFGLMAPS